MKNLLGPVQIGKDIKISRKNHDKLVVYLRDRLEWANNTRNPFVDRLESIDKELYGYLVLDADDTKRERDNQLGHGIKPVDIKLPLTLVQLYEGTTVLLQMLAPDEGMYAAVAPVEQQQVAKAFTQLMNQHDKTFGHYTEVAKTFNSAFKYNAAGVEVTWEDVQGDLIVNDNTNAPKLERRTVRSGNSITALSMYNTIWDPSVPMKQLATHGEFYATIKLHTPFRIRKMIQDGEIFNADRLTLVNLKSIAKYYRRPPEIRSSFSSIKSRVPDWDEIFTGSKTNVGGACEFVNVCIWIDPKEFGIRTSPTSNNLQIWRITLANDDTIVKAVHLTNAHGMLPASFGVINDDELGLNTKSYGELLTPFNRFASFQMNIHQRAARKALNGMTYYNKRVFPGLANVEDMSSGKVAAEGNPDDLRKSILQIFDAPRTEHTLRDISATDDMMQKVLPTDLRRQITDLERATRYQAAATVQSTDRRLHTTAKMLDSQILTTMRHMQMYNILQFQQEVKLVSPQGELIDVNPSEFREANLEFAVSAGLSGLDKLSLIEGIKEILNSILQSQTANQQIDVVAVINYLTTLMGDKSDFAQFKYKSEMDKLPPEQRDLAFQLLQQFIQQQQAAQGATA